MTIRTRMTLWYAGVLLVSALAIAGLSLKELHEERGKVEEPGDSLEDVLGFVCGIGIPAILLSVGGGWWLMRKALAPVAALTEAASRINEHNLGQRLPRTGDGGELDRLTEVFNAMTERLEQSFLRIREFTLHASHELKTPLTVMRGELETALEDKTLPASQREHVVSELDELQRLTKIVDGLTLLTKADAGQVSLELQPVALDEIVHDNFADAQILAQAVGLSVKLTTCEAMMVRGDAHRLRQVLLNLADNAVKYNQPRGSIIMALRRADDSAEFTIANTGPGIGPEALPRVFDRFFRGDPAHSHEVEGCGLGLSIAQWIVSVHNGSIRIESVPFESTAVTVRLPLLHEGT
jgi:signal transduction histidine kinase